MDGTTGGSPESGSLGELLRDHRRRVGLTQAEMAGMAAVSVATLRDIEQGRVVAPRPSTLHKLGTALGSPGALLAGPTRSPRGGAAPAGSWVGVLGPLVARRAGAEVDPGSEVQRVLLGLLALSPNAPVTRERLLERLGAIGRPTTPGGLAARMSRLRHRLATTRSCQASAPAGLSVVATADGGYELRATEESLDLLAFRAAVRQARRHQAAGDISLAWERYADAVRLWRGEPLTGLATLADDPAVVGLVRQLPAVAAEFAVVGAQLGRHDEVIPVLQRVVAVDPLHEVAHARLMVALAGVGRQAEALMIFDVIRRRLDTDLGTVPGPELVRSHRQVLRQEVVPPPMATLPVRHSLPADPAGFAGRERQLRWLREQVGAAKEGPWAAPASQPPPPALVVIEGEPGVGKSRLAVHFAHQLVAAGSYAAQQLYVDLVGGADPATPGEVLASLLGLLGVPAGEPPPDLAECAGRYRELLVGTPTLVLLDHVTDPAQVAPLLPGTPGSLTLVTSRHPLWLPGAVRLKLGNFAPAEALAVLAATVGEQRVRADRAGAQQLLTVAGGYPAAVAAAAAWLQHRPTWNFAEAADRLATPLARQRREHPQTARHRYGLHDLVRDYLGEAR